MQRINYRPNTEHGNEEMEGYNVLRKNYIYEEIVSLKFLIIIIVIIIIIIKKGRQCGRPAIAVWERFTPYQSKDPNRQFQPIEQRERVKDEEGASSIGQ